MALLRAARIKLLQMYQIGCDFHISDAKITWRSKQKTTGLKLRGSVRPRSHGKSYKHGVQKESLVWKLRSAACKYSNKFFNLNSRTSAWWPSKAANNSSIMLILCLNYFSDLISRILHRLSFPLPKTERGNRYKRMSFKFTYWVWMCVCNWMILFLGRSRVAYRRTKFLLTYKRKGWHVVARRLTVERLQLSECNFLKTSSTSFQRNLSLTQSERKALHSTIQQQARNEEAL